MPQRTRGPTSRDTATRRRPSSSPGASPVELPTPKLSAASRCPNHSGDGDDSRNQRPKTAAAMLSNLLWRRAGQSPPRPVWTPE